MTQECWCHCAHVCGPAQYLWVTATGTLFPLCTVCLAGWRHNALTVPSLQPRSVQPLGPGQGLVPVE